MTDVEVTIYETAVGGALGFIAALAGAYFGVKYQSKRVAQQVFYDSILEILLGLYPDQDNWPRNSYEILQKKIPEIRLAVSKFRFHLSPRQVTNIDSALVKYCAWCNQINDAEILLNLVYDSTPSIDQKAVFKRHVDAILAIAKKA